MESVHAETFRPAEESAPATASNHGDESLARLRKAAEAGDPAAQTDLGLLYLGGQGVPQNGHAGMTWLRKAAENGDARAQTTLGRLYLSGYDTVGQDIAEADRWLGAAARQGDPEARKLLAEVQELKEKRQDEAAYWRRYPFDWRFYGPYAWHGFYGPRRSW